MENCAFIDIFTTQNDLFGKNNCPIQFCCEIFSNDEIFDEYKLNNPKRVKFIKIIPDEDIMVSGYINSGYSTDDTKKPEYCGTDLKQALEAIYKILSTLKTKGFYIIGYNHINYDMDILNKNFSRILNAEPIVFDDDHIIDVMKLAEYMIPVDVIGSYTMDSVLTYLHWDLDEISDLHKTPSTAKDISVTKEILSNLIRNGEKFSELVNELNTPRTEKIISFGKYKGADIKYIVENDIQYCNWIVRNKDIARQRPGLVNTIKSLMNTTVEQNEQNPSCS